MKPAKWAALPVETVPVDRLVWPCHDIDPAHTHSVSDRPVAEGPIHVEQLMDGSLFVHDGRHRAIRATLRGDRSILARVARPIAGRPDCTNHDDSQERTDE